MARLYFRYGAMGSSKTANALMVAYNYRERGRHAILAKPALDTRDGTNVMASRIGLSHECVPVESLVAMSDDEICGYDASSSTRRNSARNRKSNASSKLPTTVMCP